MCPTLMSAIKSDLKKVKTYGEFSFHLTHRLMDHLGLIILRMSDPQLKRAFIPQLKRELLERPSQQLVQTTQTKIKEAKGYDSQAHAREINLFYIDKHGRNRIEHKGDSYYVLNTDIRFSEAQLLETLNEHPERFSPNVVMRPLYQDTILPNLAYIGGGGELAYWMERKTQFEEFGVPFPMLIRRQSGMILTASMDKQRSKLGLAFTDIFKDENELTKLLLSAEDIPDYSLSAFKKELSALFAKMENHIGGIDSSLSKTTGAEA